MTQVQSYICMMMMMLRGQDTNMKQCMFNRKKKRALKKEKSRQYRKRKSIGKRS